VRAGKSGISMVIITRSELRKIKAIENKIQQDFISKKIPTGMEICEIQLYHLANKIKDTKVNQEVDSYLPAINDVLQGIDREELIKKIVSVEFTRFFNYYNKTKDLNTSDSGDRSERGRSRDGDSRIPADGNVRYFINVGEKDGYDWMSLKDFLRDTVNLGKDDIFKVDVKDSFSFFNTDAAATEAILKTFTEFKVDGRFVNVEVSKNPGGSGGGGGRGRRDRSRSGGGRDSRDSDRNKGRRRDRSASKGSSASSSGKRRTKRKSDFF
jgi:ATP-dependent RNA helicase DeaD